MSTEQEFLAKMHSRKSVNQHLIDAGFSGHIALRLAMKHIFVVETEDFNRLCSFFKNAASPDSFMHEGDAVKITVALHRHELWTDDLVAICVESCTPTQTAGGIAELLYWETPAKITEMFLLGIED